MLKLPMVKERNFHHLRLENFGQIQRFPISFFFYDISKNMVHGLLVY